MKQFHKKKIKKKKKNQISEEIMPMKHDKIGNLNLFSEEVSKEIIEKLISLTISKSFSNKIDNKINKCCLEEFLRKINNLVQLNNINHEVDEYDNSDYILSKIYYQKTDANNKRYQIKKHENALNKRNYSANLVLFDIANINKDDKTRMYVRNKKIDDYLNKSTYSKNNIDLIKRRNIQFDITIKDNNFWGEIHQPKPINIDRSSTKRNILILQKDKNLENKNILNNIKNNMKILDKKASLYLSKRSKIFQDKYKNDKNDEITKKMTKYQPILEMPYIEISEDNKYKDNDEIKELRQKTLDLIQEREEKRKKNKNKAIKTQNKNKYIKGKFCTDCEGKLVMIKEIDPESLLREFWPITSNQKDILSGKTIQAIQKEKYILEQNAKKNIIYNPGFTPVIVNNNLLVNKDNQKPNEASKKKNSKNKTNDNVNQIKEEIYTIQPPPLMHISPKNERIEPSGSNFEIISPSVGVKIKEKNRLKTGGVNFYDQFQKLSINEFNKTLKETLEWETKTKLKGNFFNIYNKNTIKEENNIYEIDENDKNNNKEKYFRKTFSGGFKTRKNILKSNSDLFTINQKNPTLRQVLLNDDELKTIKKIGKSLSNENIFDRVIRSPTGRILNHDLKKFNFDLINEFNKELIMGNFKFKKSNKIFLPQLPPKNKSAFPKSTKNYNIFNKTANNFYRTRQKKNIDAMACLSNPTSANNKKKRVFSSLKDNNIGE